MQDVTNYSDRQRKQHAESLSSYTMHNARECLYSLLLGPSAETRFCLQVQMAISNEKKAIWHAEFKASVSSHKRKRYIANMKDVGCARRFAVRYVDALPGGIVRLHWNRRAVSKKTVESWLRFRKVPPRDCVVRADFASWSASAGSDALALSPLGVTRTVVTPCASKWHIPLNELHFRLLRSSGLSTDYDTSCHHSLGTGANGHVCKAIHRVSGCEVAVKLLKRSDLVATFHELSILQIVSQHKHVVKVLDSGVHGGRLAIVFEAGGQDLGQILKKRQLRATDIKQVTKQTLEALAFVHGRNVVHADVKPPNILVRSMVPSPLHVLLCDFGLALLNTEGCKHTYSEAEIRKHGLQVCTLLYRAPEILFGCTNFGSPSDVWSMGIVLFEMADASNKFFSTRQNEVSMRFALFRLLGTPRSLELQSMVLWPQEPAQLAPTPWGQRLVRNIGANGMGVLESMLAWEPHKRPSSAQCFGFSYCQHD
jgi:hypothetical protein